MKIAKNYSWWLTVKEGSPSIERMKNSYYLVD
jgi:hypothetical protein